MIFGLQQFGQYKSGQRCNCCHFFRCFQCTKIPSSSRKHQNQNQDFCFTLFTRRPLPAMKCLSLTVNYTVAVALLLTSSLHCCQQRIYNKWTMSRHTELAFSPIDWRKFLFLFRFINNFSTGNARKVVYFVNMVQLPVSCISPFL